MHLFGVARGEMMETRFALAKFGKPGLLQTPELLKSEELVRGRLTVSTELMNQKKKLKTDGLQT
jgi:hypothetical protein